MPSACLGVQTWAFAVLLLLSVVYECNALVINSGSQYYIKQAGGRAGCLKEATFMGFLNRTCNAGVIGQEYGVPPTVGPVLQAQSSANTWRKFTLKKVGTTAQGELLVEVETFYPKSSNKPRCHGFVVAEKETACTTEPLANKVHIHAKKGSVWALAPVKGKLDTFTLRANSRKAGCLKYLAASASCNEKYLQLDAKDDGSGRQHWTIIPVKRPTIKSPPPSPVLVEVPAVNYRIALSGYTKETFGAAEQTAFCNSLLNAMSYPKEWMQCVIVFVTNVPFQGKSSGRRLLEDTVYVRGYNVFEFIYGDEDSENDAQDAADELYEQLSAPGSLNTMLNTTFPTSNFSPDAVDNGIVEKPAEELPKPQSPGASPESSSPKLTSPEPTPSPNSVPTPTPTPVPTPVPTPDFNQAPTTSPAPSNGNGGGGGGGGPAPTIPGVPTDVEVTLNTGISGAVNVAWSAPTSNGGAAITSYDIQCTLSATRRRKLLDNLCSGPVRRRKLMGETGRALLTPFSPIITTTASASVCTGNSCISTGMTGLASGSVYTCKVLARNSVGPSAYSVESCYFAMPTVPFSPRDVELTLITGAAGAINVAWRTPLFDGGSPVISYDIECTPAAIGKRKLLTESPIIATGLNPVCSGGVCNTMMTGMTILSRYTCKVLASNIVGPSPYSSDSCSIIISTVPDAPTIGVFSANTGCAGTVNGAWTAPNDGGDDITSYDIHCTVTANKRRKLLLNPLINVPASVCSGSSCVVTGMTGLDGGFAFACSVRAVNSVGPSAYSSAALDFSLPIAAPGVPTIGAFSASTVTAEAVNGAWTAPTCDGGSPITAYDIQCTSNDAKRRRLLIGSTVTIRVDSSVCTGSACADVITGMGGLAAGSTYSCKVLAINSGNFHSAYSSASAPFLIPICGIGKYLDGAECVDCTPIPSGYFRSDGCFDTFDSVFNECTVCNTYLSSCSSTQDARCSS